MSSIDAPIDIYSVSVRVSGDTTNFVFLKVDWISPFLTISLVFSCHPTLKLLLAMRLSPHYAIQKKEIGLQSYTSGSTGATVAFISNSPKLESINRLLQSISTL